MEDFGLSTMEEQARLVDASKCGDCKRIWARFSNDFCPKHSTEEWRTTARQLSHDLPINKSSSQGRSTSMAAVKKSMLPTLKSIGTTQLSSIVRRFGWMFGLTAVLGGCIALGSLIPDSWTEESTATTTTTLPMPTVVPSFIDSTFGAATEAISKVFPLVEIGYVEVTSGLEPADEMVVVDQAPPIGASTAGLRTICLAVVRESSRWMWPKWSRWKLDDSCGKTQKTLETELKQAWVPYGLQLTDDENMNGFAAEPHSPDAGIYLSEEVCTQNGVVGICFSSRLASKNGCPRGAEVVVRWVTRGGGWHDRSNLRTTPMNPSEIVNFSGFYAYTSREQQLKVIRPMLLSVRC